MIGQIEHLLEEALRQGSFMPYLLMFGGGLLASLTPCTYPVLPLTVGYIGHQAGASRLRVFLMSLSLVTGLATVYAVLGVIVAAVGGTFGAIMGNGVILYAVAMYFLIMGLFLLDVFSLPTPEFLTRLQSKSANRKGVLGAFVVGGVSGLIVGPCTGPILAVALGAIALTLKNVHGILYVLQALKGGILLFLFGLGQGALILLAGIATGFLIKLPKAGQWMETVKKGFALMIIGAATLLFVFVGQNTDFPSLTRLLASTETSLDVAPHMEARIEQRIPEVLEPAAGQVAEPLPSAGPKGEDAEKLRPQPPSAPEPPRQAEAPRPAGSGVGARSKPQTPTVPVPAAASPVAAGPVVALLPAAPAGADSPAAPPLSVRAPAAGPVGEPAPAPAAAPRVDAAKPQPPAASPSAPGKAVEPAPAPAVAPRVDAAKPQPPAVAAPAPAKAMESQTAAAPRAEPTVKPAVRAAASPPKPAPDFTLYSMERERVKLSELRGKKGVVLAFFATWCVTCMTEVPELKKFAPMAQKENVLFFAVDYKQPEELVERFRKSMQVDYKILLDATGTVTTESYGITGLPHIVGINGRGEIIYRGVDLPENKGEFIRNLKEGL
jgi:thiol:disulfide interchange protein DsbD